MSGWQDWLKKLQALPLLAGGGALLLLFVLVAGLASPEPGPDSEPAPETRATPDSQPAPEIQIAGTVDRSSLLPEVIVPATPENEIHLVLILDDIGNNGTLGQRAVQLPGQVTYAVLPHTPFGRSLAEMAHAAGKEVMLHAPMSNLTAQDPGPGGLSIDMNEQDFTRTLTEAIASIPYVQGINNHTGSALTAEKKQMEWVMRVLKEKDLYFVDSLTTAKSVAAATATEFDIPNLKRNVFLDNETTEESIDYQFQRLLKIAKEQGRAVGIGHPYPETLDYLERVLPLLPEQGITLIPVSKQLALLQQQDQSSLMVMP